MAPGTHHEIANLQLSPGELSFDARVGGEEKRIWFRSETEVEPGVEAALAACLMPAMRPGGTLAMGEPISPRVLRTQREFQAIQAAWSREWHHGEPPLREVEVEAPTYEPKLRQPTGRAAALFSGGVDSWATVLSEPGVTDLIFVRGVDILPRLAHQAGLADDVEARLREAAGELGMPLHVIETNVRDISDPLVHWEAYYPCALSGAALFLAQPFDRVLISGSADYEVQSKLGAHWMVDQLWSTERLEIVDAGGRFNRMQRIELIASHPVVRKSLRVCWENPGGAYNCGGCRKCLMTMAGLEAVDGLEAVATLPSELDLEALAAIEISEPGSVTLWEDLHDAARAAGKTDLELAIATVVEGGKRALGRPPGHRRRHRPPPPRPGETGQGGARLLADPPTARALAEANGAAFLVGSYDGSGNYGDIAQLDGALGLMESLEPAVLALPVIERQYAHTHAALLEDLLHPPRHVLYFDDGSAEANGDLVAIEPPAPGLALSYLYGGGFLNPGWGDRKLAMLQAVESAISGAGRVVRLASGQQVDTGWLSGLDGAGLELLRSFELRGGRDDVSAAALAELGQGAVALNTGDDAIGILTATGSAGPAADASPLEVNVHFAEHEWVTDSPDAAREFVVGLLAELSRLARGPLRVRPLLAYLDPRIDERPGLERFAAACADSGIEVAEPCVLRPAGIDELTGELGGAAFTVSSSYHVALTSLLMAVPTAILRDNDYYAQKAEGLLVDFGLPQEFALRSSDDPVAAASAVVPHIVDPEVHDRTRRQLAAAAERMRRRRSEAEARLLAAIAQGALTAARAPTAPDSTPTPTPENGAAEAAERRAAEAEAKLGEVLGSRSWKLTAPLRRLRRLGRRA